ncbi:hypothetical protein SH1V18_32650 [Vallitalea longa]|uniref:CBM-cenC domain-containing protein n=1 Tax=Vallitalea longa TaxID=2936439 RepID=A0A9W5YDZ2_9FIRM|nr:carbohydrate binding domain-containing protein [Vallitalea longa]GKX30785.1 hypothetical protein SH1V18_32650 [Vallitalea longa]
MRKKVFKTFNFILAGFLILTMVIVHPLSVRATETTYYIDSVNGDDTNDGKSTSTPWKSLDKVNSMVFSPGDRILLKAGSVWNGQLKPKGSGTEGNPIIIDMYGEENKPIINGQGQVLITLHLYNEQYWEINNLEITNQGASELTGRTGVKIEAHDYGVANHIYLKNLDVHNVNGDSIKKDTGNGGIFFVITGDSVVTKFNDILIEDCSVKNVNRTGISVGFTSWCALYDGYGGRYPNHIVEDYSSDNVVIRNNYVETAGGDAIVPMFCNHPIIEYNVANGCNITSANAGQYSAGIWPWRCDDALFQYNEVYGTKYNGDGQAFDCDYSNRTVYQYNYSHDNQGGFMLMCQDESNDSIVRYNISQNDQVGLLSTSGKSSGHIYNNVFYIGQGLSTTPWRFTGSGDIKVSNNIFYNVGNSKSVTWPSNVTYSHNNYYGFNNYPDDSFKNTDDPQFINSGSGGIGIDTLDGYKLSPDSSLINSGTPILYSGGKDYWGNELYYDKPDIGAFEYPVGGITTPEYVNRVVNEGFETGEGSPFYPWNSSVSNSNQRTGDYCGQVDKYGSWEQVIDVLPNKTYTLTGWMVVENQGDEFWLGVKDYGGDEIHATIDSTSYTQGSIQFTTGPSASTAIIYAHRPDTGVGSGYVDDLSVIMDEEQPVINLVRNEGLETGNKEPWYDWNASISSNNQRSGSYCGKVNKYGSWEQVINVEPQKTYTLTGWLKVENQGDDFRLGVKDYGGDAVSVTIDSTSYTKGTVQFTTGRFNTSAIIYMYRPDTGVGAGYGDDFQVMSE